MGKKTFSKKRKYFTRVIILSCFWGLFGMSIMLYFTISMNYKNVRTIEPPVKSGEVIANTTMRDNIMTAFMTEASAISSQGNESLADLKLVGVFVSPTKIYLDCNLVIKNLENDTRSNRAILQRLANAVIDVSNVGSIEFLANGDVGSKLLSLTYRKN